MKVAHRKLNDFKSGIQLLPVIRVLRKLISQNTVLFDKLKLVMHFIF